MRLRKRANVLFLAASVGFSGLIPRELSADENAKALVGTWNLTGWTLRVVGETEDKEPFGPNPKGRLVMSPEGYWIVIITGADRHPAKTMDEKIALFDSVLAYSGKYT